jgi:hypothetical protein
MPKGKRLAGGFYQQVVLLPVSVRSFGDLLQMNSTKSPGDKQPSMLPAAGLLGTIQRGKSSKPPRILVYGTEGIGKSTFAVASAKPIVIDTEDGLGQFDVPRFPVATGYDSIVSSLTALHKEPHDYRTIVLDSIDWLERLIWDKLCGEYGVTSIEKCDGGYARGYTHALTHWREILALLDTLRLQRSMCVILIAHSRIERFEDPELPAYDRFAPRLHKHACGLVTEWCDAVLFATRRVRTTKEDVGFNRQRTIAAPIGSDGGERILRCIGGPACVAKNRFNLPAELPLSWPAFSKAMAVSFSTK